MIFRLGGREHEPPKNRGLFSSVRRSLCPTPPNTLPNRQSPAQGRRGNAPQVRSALPRKGSPPGLEQRVPAAAGASHSHFDNALQVPLLRPLGSSYFLSR